MNYGEIGINDQLRAVNGISGKARVYTGNTSFDAWFELPNAIIKAQQLTTGNMPFASNIVWTATSQTFASASAGTITWANGKTAYINHGEIPDIESQVFVYYADRMGTLLGTTGDYSKVIGDDKTLLAILNPGISGGKARIKLFNQTGDMLHFGQASGGTISLGGTADGNGVLSLKEQAGTEIVRLDRNGVTVNYGSITINDTSGSSVIDAKGLVGQTTFNSGFTTVANVDSVGTAWQDISGLSATISLTRQTPVLLYGYADFNASKSGVHESFRFNVNSGTIIYPNPIHANGWEGFITDAGETMSFNITINANLPAGNNVVKFQVRNGGGTTEYDVGEYTHMGYVVLGK